MVTGDAVAIAYVDQGYTGDEAAHNTETHHMQLEVVKLPEVKKGFVLLPKRCVVERRFAWTGRFRRLSRENDWQKHLQAYL
jgi:transposase